MPTWSPTPSSIFALFAFALALLFAVLWRREAGRGRRRSRARQQRSRIGEEEAVQLLIASGFEVLEHQPWTEWPMEIDGDVVWVSCRGDLLVEARQTPIAEAGSRFIAEVKTGRRAPDPTHPSTRRQLLEYLAAFDVDGVLLIDMEHGRIRAVAFPLDR